MSPISAQANTAIVEAATVSKLITSRDAKKVYELIWTANTSGPQTGRITSKEQVIKLIEDHGLKQVIDPGTIEKIVDEIIAKNPDKVADAKAKPKAIGWLIGQVMKESVSSVSPQAVNDLLKKKLGL